MTDRWANITAAAAVLACCLLGLYVALFRPGYLDRVEVIGGLIFVQVLLLVLWRYRQRFFPLLLLIFLWAGTSLPLSEAWTSGRWVVLGVGAIAGLVVYTRVHHHHFGGFHLVALFCVLAALVSAMVSSYPEVSSLKAGSLLLLFLYAATGARLAVLGREEKFFPGLLVGCEWLVYLSAIAYFVFGVRLYGNPNSLGAIMGVVGAPLLLWGIFVSKNLSIRRRRVFAFSVSVVLLLSSYARAGIIAAVISCVMLCVALRQYRLLVKGLSGALLCAAVVIAVAPPVATEPSSMVSTYLYKGQKEAGVLGSRRSVWDETVSSIRQHPWFGTGFGTSSTSYDVARTGSFASSQRTTREHGNSYLAISEWVGLLGVVPFFTLVLLIVLNVYRVMAWLRRTGDPFVPAVPMAAILAAGLVHAAFEDWLFAVGYYLCIFFWIFAFVLVDFIPATAPGLAPTSAPRSSRPWADGLGMVAPGR